MGARLASLCLLALAAPQARAQVALLAASPRSACLAPPSSAATEDLREPEACAREWRVRALALDLAALRAALEREDEHEDWRALLEHLDALRRATPLAPELERELAPFARRRLAHGQPNVRAAALAALAALGQGPREGAESRALLADRWPEVREELARALAHVSGADALAGLVALAGDADARVAGAAERVLLAREDGAEAARALLEAHERAGRVDAWLAALERAASARGPSAWLRALLERGAPAGSVLAPLARDATVAAALLARRGRALADNGLAGDGLAGTGLAGDALTRALEALSAGLELPLQDGAGAPGLELRREALVDAAARRVGAPLGEALLAQPLHALESAHALPRLRAALRALGAQALLAHVLARPDVPEVAGAAWRALASGEPELAARLAPLWLAPPRPTALRRAGAEALSSALAAELVEGRALLPWLADEDAEVSAEIFRALCEPDDPRAWLDELHAAWRARPLEERLVALTRLSRAHPLTPFREDLLALGEDPDFRTRNASTIELLAAFRDDARVGEALARWLAEDLARLEAAGEEAPERRALELRAQGLARALARVGGARALQPLLAALARCAAGDEVEVAKVLVAWIARVEGGLERLAPWLEPSAPERVRVEAALWLAQRCEPRALELLVARWDGLDGELRSRVLERFGGCADASSLALLERVALEGDGLRHQALALGALARRARESAPAQAVLARAAAEGRALELRRRALEGLGEAGATQALRAAWARFADEGAGLPEERALLREEHLSALARAGGADELVREALLERPLASACAELERRFEDKHGMATSFAWRGELAACATLAERGALDASLLAGRAWWRLDARLALELAQRLAASVPTAEDEPARGGATAETRDARAGARLAWDLARLACAGFEGEAEGDDLPELRAQALALLAALARGFARPAEEARWLARLDEELREGRVDERALALALGPGGPGRDAHALLAAAAELVRAERASGARRERAASAAREAAQGSERALALVRALLGRDARVEPRAGGARPPSPPEEGER